MRFVVLILISIAHFTIAQVNIDTPYGFKNLHIEMSTSELVDEMGEPKKMVSFEDEKKVWVEGNFDLNKAIAFHIGFDKVYVFDYQNKYCLWKAYIKDDKVVYMNLVSRFVRNEFKSNVTVRGLLHFHDHVKEFEAVMGKNFFPDRGLGYTDYLYHDLGIRFTFKQDKMTNIYLFRRLTNRADLLKLVKHYGL